MSLERQISLTLLFTALPLFLVALVLLIISDASSLSLVTFTLLLVASLIIGIVSAQRRLNQQFTGVSNVIESLRNNDFTSSLSSGDADSAWGELQLEINRLAQTLQDQKIINVESDIILEKLIEEFDIPLLVIDRSDALNNINKAGLALFNQHKKQLVGLSYHQLHLAPLVEALPCSLVEFTFPKRGGRWEVRRNVFRKGGSRFTLLLLNDLSRTLREEERKAWQSMIRVISHELNNSLSSIISIAETLQHKPEKQTAQGIQKAMGIIAKRGYGLQKFTESYAQLTKLPEPQMTDFDLGTVIRNCCEIVGGPFEVQQGACQISADSEQLHQLFINLLKNAKEASSLEGEEQNLASDDGDLKEKGDLPVSKAVLVVWKPTYYGIQIDIIDSGVGISNPDNLFVPFYTTKAEGNGIGLYLCKQIAENHNGTLHIQNRHDARGCIVSLWLPADNSSLS